MKSLRNVFGVSTSLFGRMGECAGNVYTYSSRLAGRGDFDD